MESTIIDVREKQIYLLRAGGIALEALEEFLGEKILISDGDPNKPSSPGQMLRHYAPKYETRINVVDPLPDEFYIGFGEMDCDLNLSVCGNLQEATANLFQMMHLAEEQTKKRKIAITPIPNVGLGRAINDRIKRASYK